MSEVTSSVATSYLLEVLTEERKLVASAILERNRQSTQIKQWCITLWLASWGIISFPHVWTSLSGSGAVLAIAPTMFPVFFFAMDLANKRIERKFTFRSRQIHRFLNGKAHSPSDDKSSLTHFLESNELGEFRIYDPAGMNWLKELDSPHEDEREEFSKWISLNGLLKGSWGLMYFYLGLVTASVVGTVLVSQRVVSG